jgi:outer membrane protein assembly factor BamB
VPGKQAFGSLVHARAGGQDLIVTPDGQVIDAADGRVLAKGLHKLAFCSPIVQDGVAYFVEHGGKAVRLPAGGAEAEVLWKTRPRKDRYYASPLYHDGLIYAVTRYGVLSVIDATDGTVVHSRKLKLQRKGQCYASVTFAGGHVLVGADTGETFVLRPGREAEQVGANPLEPYRSSPVFDGRRMYIRARRHLYCIAAPEG